jgi:hypothetical protein
VFGRFVEPTKRWAHIILPHHGVFADPGHLLAVGNEVSVEVSGPLAFPSPWRLRIKVVGLESPNGGWNSEKLSFFGGNSSFFFLNHPTHAIVSQGVQTSAVETNEESKADEVMIPFLLSSQMFNLVSCSLLLGWID